MKIGTQEFKVGDLGLDLSDRALFYEKKEKITEKVYIAIIIFCIVLLLLQML